MSTLKRSLSHFGTVLGVVGATISSAAALRINQGPETGRNRSSETNYDNEFGVQL